MSGARTIIIVEPWRPLPRVCRRRDFPFFGRAMALHHSKTGALADGQRAHRRRRISCILESRRAGDFSVLTSAVEALPIPPKPHRR
jgi:hypothetical protein